MLCVLLCLSVVLCCLAFLSKHLMDDKKSCVFCPHHDPCTCVFCPHLVIFVFHSLVHGFDCVHYEVSKGFDLRATFRHNVKGTTRLPTAPKLDGKFNLISVSNSSY